MASIEVYTFEDSEGMEDTFTTTDPTEARERARQYRLLVTVNEYEWSDSETFVDFREEG